jgi:hypothetical protein
MRVPSRSCSTGHGQGHAHRANHAFHEAHDLVRQALAHTLTPTSRATRRAGFASAGIGTIQFVKY